MEKEDIQLDICMFDHICFTSIYLHMSFSGSTKYRTTKIHSLKQNTKNIIQDNNGNYLKNLPQSTERIYGN